MAAMPPTTIYVHTSDQPCPGAAVADGGRVATAEHPGPFYVTDESRAIFARIASAAGHSREWTAATLAKLDHLAPPAEPVEADDDTEAVWSLRRIYTALDGAMLMGLPWPMNALRMLLWHVQHDEAEAHDNLTTIAADGPVNGAPSVTVHRSYTADRPTAVDVDVTNRTLSMHTHGITGGPPYDLDPDEALALAYDLATAAHVLGGLDR